MSDSKKAVKQINNLKIEGIKATLASPKEFTEAHKKAIKKAREILK